MNQSNLTIWEDGLGPGPSKTRIANVRKSDLPGRHCTRYLSTRAMPCFYKLDVNFCFFGKTDMSPVLKKKKKEREKKDGKK